MGQNVADLDMLRSNHGPAMSEAKSRSGRERVENATGEDFGRTIAEFFERNQTPG